MRWVLYLALVALLALPASTTIEQEDEEYSTEVENDVDLNKVLSFRDNCTEEGTKCDQTQGLLCSPLGQCQCPLNLNFSEETKKCGAAAVSSSTDFLDNWPEEDVLTWDLPADTPESNSLEKAVVPVVPKKLEETKVETKVETKAPSIVPQKPVSLEVESSELTVSEEAYWNSEVDSAEDQFWSSSSEETDEGEDLPAKLQPRTVPAPCTEHTDCHNQGVNFACDLPTGKCGCFGAEKVEVNGTCYMDRGIDDPCTLELECDALIAGPAWCHMDLESGQGTCQCQPFSYWEPELEECLPFASQGLQSPCRRDAQCSGEDGLGPHARCSQVTGMCECSSSALVVFFEDRCIEERDLEGTCRTDQDCQASLGPHAICDHQNECQCKEGHSCNNLLRIGGFTIQGSPITALSLGIVGAVGALLILVAIVMFVFRRGNHYTFVDNEA